jgi:hypothetical protein
MIVFGYNPMGNVFAPSVVENWPDYNMDATLRPVDISKNLETNPLDEEPLLFSHEIGPREQDLYWFIMGFRVFNKPREVMIEEVVIDCRLMYRHAFDAASFNLDMPPLPLRNDGKPYTGEPIRFVKQDLGYVALHRPIRFMIRPWEPGLAVRFDAIMVVREDRPVRYPGTSLPCSHASGRK